MVVEIRVFKVGGFIQHCWSFLLTTLTLSTTGICVCLHLTIRDSLLVTSPRILRALSHRKVYIYALKRCQAATQVVDRL